MSDRAELEVAKDVIRNLTVRVSELTNEHRIKALELANRMHEEPAEVVKRAEAYLEFLAPFLRKNKSEGET